MKKQLKELKKGEWFTLKEVPYPTDEQVYIKGEYDRATKKYSCCKYGDMNCEKFFSGSKLVFDEFIF